MSAVDSDRIAASALLGRGLPLRRSEPEPDGELLDRIDALAARVDRLIVHLTGDQPTDAVSQP